MATLNAGGAAGGEQPPDPDRRALRRQVNGHAVAFLAGLSAVFVALGFSAGLVSEALFAYGDLLRLVAGAVLIVMGTLMLGVVRLPFLQRDLRPHLARKPGGYAGSALVGVAFAAGWTPCVGPILAGILALAGSSGSGVWGAVLLGSYALGFAVPFLLAAQTMTVWSRWRRHAALVEKIGGALLIAVGVVVLTDWIGAIAPYLASLGSLETVLLTGAEPGLLLAFVAGVLSFGSPCVLPILPSFLAYLTGMSAEQLTAAR